MPRVFPAKIWFFIVWISYLHVSVPLIGATKGDIQTYLEKANANIPNGTTDMIVIPLVGLGSQEKEKHDREQHARRRQIDKNAIFKECTLELVLDDTFVKGEGLGRSQDAYEKVNQAMAKAHEILWDIVYETSQGYVNFAISVRAMKILYSDRTKERLRLSKKRDDSLSPNFCLTLIFLSQENVKYSDLEKNLRSKIPIDEERKTYTRPSVCQSSWSNDDDSSDSVKVNWVLINTMYVDENGILINPDAEQLGFDIARAVLYSVIGKFDDPQDPKCSPGGRSSDTSQDEGDYLMSSKEIVDGSKARHSQISPCSLELYRAFAQHADAEKCMPQREVQGTDRYPKCGNGWVDEEEECDCGSDEESCDAVDKCCSHENCTLKMDKNFECSPHKHTCCRGDCRRFFLEEKQPCSLSFSDASDPCGLRGYCDGVSYDVCPTGPRAGRLCADGRRTCSDDGQCTASLCDFAQSMQLQECNCTRPTLPGEDKICTTCCARNNGMCMPLTLFMESELIPDSLHSYKVPGTECVLSSGEPGFCDGVGNCIEPPQLTTLTEEMIESTEMNSTEWDNETEAMNTTYVTTINEATNSSTRFELPTTTFTSLSSESTTAESSTKLPITDSSGTTESIVSSSTNGIITYSSESSVRTSFLTTNPPATETSTTHLSTDFGLTKATYPSTLPTSKEVTEVIKGSLSPEGRLDTTLEIDESVAAGKVSSRGTSETPLLAICSPLLFSVLYLLNDLY